MKKRFFSLLLVLCLVVTMVPTAVFATEGSTSAGENLLVNPGGEITAGGTVLISNGWEGSNRLNSYQEAYLGIGGAQEGAYYIAVGAPNGASISSAPHSCYQDIPIPDEKAGGAYSLTGYLCANGSGNRATLRIEQLDSSKSALSGGGMDRSTTENSWTQVNMTANLLPGAKYLRVSIEGLVPSIGAAAFDNLSLTLTPPPSVAVNTTTNTEYASLQKAVETVAEGETIQLLDDITLIEQYLYIAYNFTLDLNGNTLTKSSDSDDGIILYHDGYGMLTITDSSAAGGGRITSASSTPDSGTIYIYAGDLTLRGVTVENTAEEGNAIKSDAIKNGYEGKISIPGGNVVIRGGGFAMDTAPDLSKYPNAGVTASTDISGMPAETYDPADIATYKYLAFQTRVTNSTLTDQLIAPAIGGTPAAAITEDPQYTGTVSWNGNPSKFLGGTAYTATVTLTAKSGYTFQGVAENTFAYAGAAGVTNAAGSGNTMTVTIVFPETALPTLQSIAVTKAPDKTVYQFGETFQSAGMEVKATYNDDTEDADFTAYTVDKTGALTMSDTTVTLTATADSGITATQSITIHKADGPAVTGVAAEGCTTSANHDGKLTGVTTAMEYRKSGDAGYTSGTGSDITGLTSGAYDVRMKETATHSAGADSTITVASYVPAPLTGTVTISGTLKYGQTLTAAYGSGNSTGILSYQWKRGGTNIGTNSDTYSLVEDDINQTLTCEVTSTEQTGSVTSDATAAIGKADGPAVTGVAADGCTTSANHDGKLTGVTTAMEYRKSGDAGYISGTGSDITGLTSGAYDVRMKETATHSAGADSTITVASYVPAALTGTVTISGTLKYGQTLTAAYGSGNSTGILSYQWKRGGTNIGTNSDTYSLVEDDINQTLTCEVTSTEQTGSVTSDATAAIGKADGPSVTGVAAVGCTTSANHDGKLTGVTTAMEYRKSGDAGYTSGTGSDITGLTSGTYDVRMKETATHSAGEDSSFTVASYVPAALTGTVTISGTLKYGQTLTAAYGSGNSTGILSYQWKRGGTNIGTNSDTYSLVEDDINQTLTCEVTSTEQTGSVASDATSLIGKADGPAVTGVAAVGCTTSANHDGKLTGVTTAMEYRKSGDTGYTSGTGSDITGLTSGAYDVRMKETATHSAGADSIFTVAEYVPTHTITAAAGTGGGISPSGSVTVNNGANQTFTITPYRGYSIADVKVDDVSQNKISSYTFTNVTANHTISAAFSYNGGSSSGSGGSDIVTPPITGKPTQVEVEISGIVDGKGNAIANITSKSLAEALDKALAYARKNGNEQNGITLVLNVSTGNKTVNNVTVNLPKAAWDTIIAKKIVNTVVVVDHPDITIEMDLATVEEINRQANADVNITATRVDSSKLTGSAKTAVGSRPVFDLKVNYGSGKAVQSFGAGNVSVTIPYTLGANEKAGNIQAVYVDENGKVHWLASSVYDRANKVLRFSTSHFSTYGVGYKQDASSLTDISTHWAKDDILFVVNQGLLAGTTSSTFSPNTAVTRGMFVTALGRLANADVSSYKQSSFNDVKTNAYYMGYIEWANKNSIINGIGNGKFAPDQPITREQMAIVMQNYARAMGFALPKAYVENTFADDAKIRAYARDAVKQMQMAGILSGKNGNCFDPQGTATRAEASAVLQRFIKNTEKYDKEIN